MACLRSTMAGCTDVVLIPGSIGPIHVLPTAFRIIPTLLSDTDWRKRYAALSAIGTLAEASAKEYLGNVEQIMR